MNNPDTLCIRTRTGLTLRLTHHHNRHMADDVSGTLFLPLKRADRNHRAYGDTVAFIAGGARHTNVYIDHVDPRFPSVPPSLWLGGANIDLDANAATTVQAWLDSRTPYTAPEAAPVPDTLPRGIATPAAPETCA